MKDFSYIIVIALGILLTNTSSSQVSILNFHQLTSKEGLSESTNDFLYMDEDRFTWIGSMDGVNYFDGKTVTVFKSNTNNSNSIQGVDVQSPFFEDDKGNIWFTTGEAINSFQKNTGTLLHDFANGQEATAVGVHYAFHLEQNRYLWVVSDEQLYRYDTHRPHLKKRQPFLDNFGFGRAAIAENDKGEPAFIYRLSGMRSGFELINCNDKTRHTWFGESDTDESLMIFQVIPDIDGHSTACLLTSDKLLFFNPNCPQDYYFKKYPSDFPRISAMEKVGNRLLLTNDQLTIAQFDLTDSLFLPKRIRAFNLDEQKDITGIDHIFLGRDSILWLAVDGKGVYYANLKNQGTFSVFNKNMLPQKRIRTLFETKDGAVSCVSQQGECWTFDDEKNLQKQEQYPGGFKQIQLQNGEIWATNGFQLAKKEHQQFDWFMPPLNDAYLFDMIPFRDNSFFLGTSAGLRLYSEDAPVRLIGSDSNFAVDLAVDSKNRLWMANASDQLFVLKIELNPFQVDTIAHFSNMGIMNDMREDTLRQAVWVATSKGLVKIKENATKKQLEIETIITESSGLSNQYIQSILLDKYSNIWLSTNRGITRFIPEADAPCRFRTFSDRDGLANEYLPGAALASKSEELWFGSTKGVDVIDPDFEDVGTVPRLKIKQLNIWGEVWKGDKPIYLKDKIVLEPQQNTLDFELSALEYLDPVRNQFKVYLSHNDRIDSSVIRDGNSVNYSYLAAGDYVFEFTACNAEGKWQKEKYKLAIEIKPYFHETLWFRTLIIGLISLIFIALSSFYYRYQLRAKQLELEKEQRLSERRQQILEKRQALQSERDRIASEMHDELGGGLSTIRNASAIAVRKQNPQDATSTLNRISQISLTLIKNMRELIWAMDPENDSLQELIARMRFFSSEFLNDNNVPLTIDIPENIPECTVTSQARHHLFLTLKELLHNIVKHSAATQVNLAINFTEQLRIVVSDNGRGFDVNHKKEKSYGLKNCTNRITSIDGRIVWETAQHKGVIVRITVSFENLEKMR